MGKVGKVAQRVKGVDRKIPCTCGGTVIPVKYYPERGKPVDARGCESCKRVWNPRSGITLAEGVKLGI